MADIVPPQESAPKWLHRLFFIDLLEDAMPKKISWTKVGVMMSTVFTTVTGAAATIQSVIGTAAHTDWSLFASAIGLHTVTKGMHEMKRYTEKK